MVGVKRSKGCRLCVSRRVRCDMAKPTCNNCKKGNRPCPGYNQDLKFQDEGARLRQRYENQATPAGSDSSRDSTASPPGTATVDLPSFNTIDASGASALRSEDTHGAAISDRSRHWDVVGLDMNQTQRRTFLGLLEGKSEAYTRFANSGQPTFTLESFGDFTGMPFYNHIDSDTSMQNQMITTFTQSLYPDNNTLPPYLKNHVRWLSHLPALTGTNPLLDTSVRAVTLVHIGRLNNSEPFVMESRPYYGKALRLLNSALQDKVQGTKNETLCAVILLSFYEMFASDNNDSWVRHAGGVSALMRARGPERHRYGLDREIFLAYRFMLIVESFQEDVPCFLAASDWQKLSRDIHADLKKTGVSPERMAIFDLAEEFYQSMVVLPAQSSDARSMWASRVNGTKPRCSRAELIEKMTKSRVEFKAIFTKFGAALSAAGIAPTITINTKDSLISIDYHFVNTFSSATFTGYWTVLIVLNLCLQGLQREDQEMVDLYKTEAKECALHICRSSASMLTSSFLGPFFLIFGLRVGLLVFEDTEGPETDWILRKLFEIGDRHMGIAKHVPGYRAGITVEELIAEFKEKKAESKRSQNISEQKEFERNVAHGRIFDEQQQRQRDAQQSGQDETLGAVPGINFNNLDHNWQGLNQVEEVDNTWDNQDNFPIHEMDSLNFATDTSASTSKQTTPTPPPASTNDRAGRFAVPDANFWSADTEWDASLDNPMAERLQWENTEPLKARPSVSPNVYGVNRFFQRT